MELTKRQAIYLTLICLFASKVQRLPSLVSSAVGRHGYMVFLIMGTVDVLMLLLCLFFNRLAGNKTAYTVLSKTVGGFFTKALYFVFAIYFLFCSLLPYEAIHDLFGNILFDHLSWEVYSLLFIIAALFIAARGLKNLGRLSEVFFPLIVVSLVALLLMGSVTTDFNQILPFADMDFAKILGTCFKYNLWFGDFLIIYMFVGKIKKDDKPFALPMTIAFTVGELVMTFAYIVFFGLFRQLANEQNSLISSISQFSLLDLDIGRVDWFFVLFFQFAAVISACLYIYLSGYALYKVFKRHKTVRNSPEEEQKRSREMAFIFAALLVLVYFLDILVFKSNQEGVSIMATITKYFGVFVVDLLPVLMFVCVLAYAKKRKKQDKNALNALQNLQFVKKVKRKPAKNKPPKKLRVLEESE